jgi:hypothetical protein
VNGALADRLDRLVQQGKLTRAQADAILKHARADGGGFPFGGWAPSGRPADDLMKELRSGKSPAAIAKRKASPSAGSSRP